MWNVCVFGLSVFLCLFAGVAEALDVRLLRDVDSNYYCVSAGSSINNILIDGENKNKLTPVQNFYFICDDTNANCIANWSLENSIKNKLGPVLDKKWEDLQIYSGKEYKGNIKFNNGHKFEVDENINLPISVKIEKDLSVFLCDDKNEFQSNCYWLIIGGWNGMKTGIRKCKPNQIPAINGFYNYPKECKELKKNNTHGIIFSTKTWSHITIKTNAGKISIDFLKNGIWENLLEWEDTANLINVKYAIVTLRSQGQFKVHDYNYFYTNIIQTKQFGQNVLSPNTDGEFCIFMYVMCCKTCQLTISLYHDQILLEERSAQTIDNSWTEFYFSTHINYTDELYVFVKTTNHGYEAPFWAIRGIRSCSKTDVWVGQVTSGKCAVVQKDGSEIILQEQWPVYNYVHKCSNLNEVMIGSNCFRNNLIQSNLICIENECYCSAGYSSESSCRKECKDKTYGYNCQENCGNCETHWRYRTCSPINGTCFHGCSSNRYSGNTCKIGTYPVLNESPDIIEVGYDFVTLKLKSNTLQSYNGKEQPSTYKFFYTAKNLEQESHKYSWFDLKEVNLTSLSASTTYEIKTVLFTYEGNYDKENAPKQVITTKCIDIEKDDIEILILTSTSATIKIKDKLYRCKISNYDIYLNNTKMTFSKNQYEAKNLQSFESYVIIFQKSNELLTTVSFRTLEGVPGAIKNLQNKTVTNTTVQIEWKAPLKANGIITKYIINIQHENYIGCQYEGSTIRNSYADQFFESTTTNFDIKNLLPYSIYNIEVSAVTGGGQGPSASLKIETSSSDNFENEIPNFQIVPSAINAKVSVEKHNCTLRKGPLVYVVNSTCQEKWCELTPKSQKENDVKSFDINGLHPYSNYTLLISVKRSFSENSLEVTKTFQTLPAAPSKFEDVILYAFNSTTVFLRIKEPYPPNGILETIKVWDYYDSSYVFYFPAVKCEIWSNDYCIEVKYKYYIYISPKNKDVPEYTSGPYFTLDLNYKEPEYPKQLSYFFDENNSLHISWQHPDKINGILKKFEIDTQPSSRPTSVSDDLNKLNFTKEISMPYNGWSDNTKEVRVRACNEKYCSGYSKKTLILPPKIPKLPETIDIELQENSITIPLENVENNLDKDWYLAVILASDDENSETIKSDSGLYKKVRQNCNFNNTNQVSLIYAEKGNKLSTITINNDTKYHHFDKFNTPTEKLIIKSGIHYEVCVVLINENTNNFRFSTQKNAIFIKKPYNPVNTFLSIFIPLLIILAIIVWVYHRKKNNKNVIPFFNMPNVANNPDVIPLAEKKETVPPKIPVKPKLKPVLPMDKNTFSKPVKLEDFEEYVKQSLASDELQRQHNLFPRGQTMPWDYGILPANKAKNRYNNLIAYDHSRVILEKLDGDPHSDYINANYIDGYGVERAYIATQGPKVSTVNDFWRMVWQENVQYIIMLANVIEGGKKKTEQYWPNINESLSFKKIKVTFISTEVFADFEYRRFTVKKGKEERRINQLHFTSWPDHGVPLYAQSVVAFIRKCLTIPQKTEQPIVVHCSAGVGRTGTVILLDICLRMAAKEGVIDVLWYQKLMRDQRPNMVDNVQQYKLVHMVLLECLFAPQTCISCNPNFEKIVDNICKSNEIDEQILYLKNSSWQDQIMKSMVGDNNEDQKISPHKNRFYDIVPDKFSRIFLPTYPHNDEDSSYINAVQVNSFRNLKKFLVTQQPLPETLGDFWRMIHNKEVTLIVSLNEIDGNDKSCPIFWPTPNCPKLTPVPFLQILYVKTYNSEIYDIITVELSTKGKEHEGKWKIQIILFKDWPYTNVLPKSPQSLLSLYEEVERISHSTESMVITCYDGARASGLFLGTNFVIEKIKLEQCCDVCLAVRVIRNTRPQFIKEREQYMYLYKIAVQYLNGFETYSNFN